MHNVMVLVIAYTATLTIVGIGLFLLHFGYSFHRFTLRVLGFALGLLVGFCIGAATKNMAVTIIASGTLGLLGAAVAPLMEKIIIFVLGGLFLGLLGAALVVPISRSEQMGLLVAIPLFVLGGVLAVWYQRLVLMFIYASSGTAAISLAEYTLRSIAFSGFGWRWYVGREIARLVVIVYGVLFQRYLYKLQTSKGSSWDFRPTYYICALIFVLVSPFSRFNASLSASVLIAFLLTRIVKVLHKQYCEFWQALSVIMGFALLVIYFIEIVDAHLIYLFGDHGAFLCATILDPWSIFLFGLLPRGYFYFYNFGPLFLPGLTVGFILPAVIWLAPVLRTSRLAIR